MRNCHVLRRILVLLESRNLSKILSLPCEIEKLTRTLVTHTREREISSISEVTTRSSGCTEGTGHLWVGELSSERGKTL